MGEVDTNPIKSVQTSVSQFGEKCSYIKSRSSSDDETEEKDVEGLLQELAKYKVQLEAKDLAYKQTLLKLDHYEKTIHELSSLLKNSELEKDMYANECTEARIHISGLESKIEEMANQVSETTAIREQLSHALTELKSTQAELLRNETQLVDATESKLEAMKQAGVIETAMNMEKEKEKMEELVRHATELNETILRLRIASMEAENAKVDAKEELEDMRERLERMADLENQLLSKSVFIDSLQSELQRANELQSLAEETAAEAISDMNRIKEDYEHQEKENSDQINYIELLEGELTQLKLELKNVNEEVEMLTSELERTKNEVEEIGNRENEAQVEVALLKSELHKGRSKVAAAEVAELKAKGEKSAAYFALHQLAIEAAEAKRENQRLKSEHSSSEDEDTQFEDSKSEQEGGDEADDEADDDEEEEIRKRSDNKITISRDEYEILVKKAEKADEIDPQVKPGSQVETLMKDLEAAMAKVRDFRTRAEQAATRAEAAEQAKAELEERIKRWKEQRQRRKAALAALREESMSKASCNIEYEDSSETYQPLSMFLKMNL